MENLIEQELRFCDEVASQNISESERKLYSQETVSERRQRISSLVFSELDGVIQLGPFKGMKLSDDPHWGISDRASMLLGLYEKEVLDYILNLPVDKKSSFIDIGAADGYYAIGFAMANRFKKSICFEAVELGRQVISKYSEINGVAEKIEINGIADESSLEKLSDEDLNRGVVLIDIEGAEFDFLNQKNLERLKSSFLIIEIHNWIDGFKEKYERLLKDAEKHFDLSILKTGQREVPEMSLFEKFPDDNRWLMLSEGRPNRMRWLCCSPKS